MPYTHEQETEFKRLFSVRRRRQMFLAASLFPMVIAAAMLRSSARQELFGIRPSMWGPGFLLLIVGALVFSFRNWRCPACDRYLGRRLNPRFCSKCGAVLQ